MGVTHIRPADRQLLVPLADQQRQDRQTDRLILSPGKSGILPGRITVDQQDLRFSLGRLPLGQGGHGDVGKVITVLG